MEKFQVSESETEVKKEKIEAEDVLKNELESVVAIADKTNEVFHQKEKLPVISTQEKRDLEMTVYTRGNRRYWMKRLLPELDILPTNIQKALQQKAEGKALSGQLELEFNTYIDKRQTVLKFNCQKRLAMEDLKDHLKEIDEKQEYVEKEKSGRRIVSYDTNTNELFVDVSGEKKKITFGDIVADYEWGIKYSPDQSVPERTWRKIRKLSDITQARRKIEQIFNQELAKIEILSPATTSWSEDFLEKYPAEGIIAEKMVKNFLTRIQYNNPDLSFRVESSNTIEDVELKYDFKVTVPEKRRGIAIESKDMPREEFIKNKRKIGIQFTISQNYGKLYKKEKQVETAKSKVQEIKYLKYIKKPVDDIVLISLPGGMYGDAFRRWLSEGKPAGGPEQYLNKEEKTKIFREVSKNFLPLSETEIENLII